MVLTNNSLLAECYPDLLHLPSINGVHCAGDAIKMGEVRTSEQGLSISEWVHVHPTVLVKPDDPAAKIKLLAAEALRGVGQEGPRDRRDVEEQTSIPSRSEQGGF